MLDFTQLFVNTALAQAANAPEPSAGSTSSIGMSFLPLLLIFGVFYILLIRPQQKKLDEQTRMIKSLKRGDRIITGGGIHGKIIKVHDDNEHLTIEIADGVQVKAVRNTVSTLAAKTEPASAKADAPEEDAKKDKD